MMNPIPDLPPEHINRGLSYGEGCRACGGDGSTDLDGATDCAACEGVGVVCDGCDDCRLGGCLCALQEHHDRDAQDGIDIADGDSA